MATLSFANPLPQTGTSTDTNVALIAFNLGSSPMVTAGANGSAYLATGTVTGNWRALYFLTAEPSATLVGSNITGFTTVAISAGAYIYGNITRITLTTGTVIAYL